MWHKYSMCPLCAQCPRPLCLCLLVYLQPFDYSGRLSRAGPAWRWAYTNNTLRAEARSKQTREEFNGLQQSLTLPRWLQIPLGSSSVLNCCSTKCIEACRTAWLSSGGKGFGGCENHSINFPQTCHTFDWVYFQDYLLLTPDLLFISFYLHNKCPNMLSALSYSRRKAGNTKQLICRLFITQIIWLNKRMKFDPKFILF